MAALGAILKALRRAVGRDLAGIFKANNLLFLGLLGKSAEALFLLLGLLLLFPLSSDPLAKIPATRLALWPLSRRQRWSLRLASVALSPVAWVGAIILVKTRRPAAALAFCGLALAMQGTLILGRYLAKHNRHWDLFRDLPAIPGRLGGLVRKNVREMLSLLDPYAALLLSIGGGAYRIFAPHPDPAASVIMGLLAALAHEHLRAVTVRPRPGLRHYALPPAAAARLGDPAGEGHCVPGDPFRACCCRSIPGRA